MTKTYNGSTRIWLIGKASKPLETKEIGKKVPAEARAGIFNRLKDLRGEGIIKGKRVSADNGIWIWWKKRCLHARV